MKAQIKFAFAVIIALGMNVSIQAQEEGTPDKKESKANSKWRDSFKEVIYEKDGKTLPYRFLEPVKVEKGKSYPLLVMLHGAKARGNDNKEQLKPYIGEIIRIASEKHQFFMVAPQCPNGKKWVDVSWGADSHVMPEKPSVPLSMVFDLIDKISKEYPVEPKCIYIAGPSMGGFGVWDAISRRPEIFAAAIPLCGGGDAAQAPKLVKLPIWVFHGDTDPTVKTQRSRDMVEAIKKAGGEPKYTEYPGVGHNCYDQTFSNPEVIEWLFSQSKK